MSDHDMVRLLWFLVVVLPAAGSVIWIIRKALDHQADAAEIRRQGEFIEEQVAAGALTREQEERLK